MIGRKIQVEDYSYYSLEVERVLVVLFGGFLIKFF